MTRPMLLIIAVAPSARRCLAALAVMVLLSVTIGRPPGAQEPGPPGPPGPPDPGVLGAAPRVSTVVSDLGPPFADLAESLEAIRQFTGRDTAPSLDRVDRTWLTPLSPSAKFECAKSGERFLVDERTRYVVRWEPGEEGPALDGVGPEDLSAAETALLSRYYPDVAASQMERVLHGPGDGRPRAGSEYCRRVGPGVFASIQWCKLGWDLENRRLLGMWRAFEPIRTDTVPRLTYEEAKAAATEFLEAWPMVLTVTPSADLMGMSAEYLRAAHIQSDDAGAQRMAYSFGFDLTWRADARCGDPWPPMSERPSSTLVCVDARTGACYVPLSSGIWPPQAREGRITGPSVLRPDQTRGSLYMLLFEPRVLKGIVYFCARYFESHLWSGTYIVDDDRFWIDYRGRVWEGRIGVAALTQGGASTRFRSPPRLFEGEVYLPADMVKAISGWSLSVEGDARSPHSLALTPPEE